MDTTQDTGTQKLEFDRLSATDVEIWLPFQNERPVDKAKALGMISWLWMQSRMHANWPVGLMTINVWPAIAHRQFLMVRHRNGSPLMYCSWAKFDEERERKYLRSTTSIEHQDWNCGDRTWVIDWVAPFGGSMRLMQKMRREIFPDSVFWALRVKSGETTGRVQDHFGVNVDQETRNRMVQRMRSNMLAAGATEESRT